MGPVQNLSLRCRILSQHILQQGRSCLVTGTAQFHNNTCPAPYRSFTPSTLQYSIIRCKDFNPKYISCFFYSTVPTPEKDKLTKQLDAAEKKLTKWQQLKKLYKEYWYIAVPVHLVTSAVWYGGFYYVAASGFDIVQWLEYYGASESIIKPFRDSTVGYFAVAYALYKVFTPLRYTVTLGGTTYSIRYLKARGIIKPVPTKVELQEILEQRKGDLKESLRETKKGFEQRKRNISDDIAHYRSTMKSLNETTKKPST